MATTATVVPAGTYPPQTRNFGPTAVPGGITQATLSLDTSNYDSGPSPVLTLSAELSVDRGVTYTQLASQSWQGPNGTRNGVRTHTTSFNLALPGLSPSDGSWVIRGSVVVAGSNYVATRPGTLTLS